MDSRERVAAARVGRLATVGADGRPHLVPICFALAGDRIVSAVDHKPKRSVRLRRLANARETGVASLLVDEYDDDWTRLWWVRVDGTVSVLPAVSPAALAALTAKYPQYAARPPAGPMLVLTADRWSAWSYSDV
ncbi:TIGR03668 family PPOX class F420-dependent oxidoreductase [Catenuloplanes atrovinosus]|uniref:PPOX class probable F420-dependent enzyme n=1 Tax=Catenuloplanes atrovinosus TaxID=137266 RepID=A0AAE4C8I3_9ACTN|nr:TIGR03668 family PPOX class F420-dependent oxidoreductase [Catenuloplanes atrovinosus]MDR7273824.1 PPOX class probable F420-dependent enzyme [Catenuloplanes atrovinosus]